MPVSAAGGDVDPSLCCVTNAVALPWHCEALGGPGGSHLASKIGFEAELCRLKGFFFLHLNEAFGYFLASLSSSLKLAGR